MRTCILLIYFYKKTEMKKSILLLLIIVYFINAKSQNESKYTGIANYSIRLAGDVFLFDGELIFTDTKSSFVYKKNTNTKWLREAEDELKGQTIYTDSSGYQIFTNLINKKLVVREFCREKQAFIYRDSVNIKWQLADEQKEIEGLKCAKATTHFRGRDYTAWYALEIPRSAGPWKFNGLPGLIIKIEDNKNEVFIVLESLKMGANINMPQLAGSTEISLKGFLINMEEAYKEAVIKNDAAISQLQAEFPDIEINNIMPEKRPATELEFE